MWIGTDKPSIGHPTSEIHDYEKFFDPCITCQTNEAAPENDLSAPRILTIPNDHSPVIDPHHHPSSLGSRGFSETHTKIQFQLPNTRFSTSEGSMYSMAPILRTRMYVEQITKPHPHVFLHEAVLVQSKRLS